MHDETLDHIDLNGHSVVEALRVLATAKATGRLKVSDASSVWLWQGAIYLAATPTSNDVAQVLLAIGVTDEAEVDQLLRTSDAGASGDLADRYPDTVPVLSRLLHEHNLAALFELIVPQDNTFEFEPDAEHPLGTRFAEQTTDLVAQAENRLQIWAKIASSIPSTNISFRLTQKLPGGSGELTVSADQWSYLALLDGKNSVSDLIRITGESAFKVCSTLYGLKLEGLIAEV